MKTLSLPFAVLALLAAASVHAAPAATEFKFQFGAKQAAPGYTLVPPSRQYAKEAGYGFEPGASVTAVSRETGDALHRSAVTASQPFQFSVAVPEGNYRVALTLGDPKSDAVTTVKAETRRPHARADSHRGRRVRDANLYGQCPRPRRSPPAAR